jgi:hypothetical protein
MKSDPHAVATARFATEKSVGAAGETKFMPPYLRYNVPSERVQINALINAAAKTLLQPDRGTSAPGTFVGITAVEPHPNLPVIDVGGVSFVTNAQFKRRAFATLELPSTASQVATGETSKLAVAGGSILPNGVVSIGWNCPTEFRASCSTKQTNTLYNWYFECGPDTFYVGSNKTGEVYFGLDGQSYYLAAQSGSGTAEFRMRCEFSSPSNSGSTVLFDPVTLNFVNQTPCVSLQNATFPQEQTPAEIVGDNHGQRPKISVTLTAPAGPSGQTVFLILDDPHNPEVGRWSAGIDSFVIPFGQLSGEWEGFLGTRKVLSEKTISIRARVNGHESQPLTIKVKKK